MRYLKTSQHAQKAIHSPREVLKQQSDGPPAFPFPEQGTSKESAAATSLSNGVVHVSKEDKDDPVDPRVLIVDDNAINLRLLNTFLKTKRTYTRVIQAEDGKKAVDAVTSAGPSPFDIIFMDISMPVMNGFEATRAIRAFERRGGSASDPTSRGAMIIALTGLASGRDQAEGFESGCDLYMTKPVRFKDVGKLLDNWELHRNSKEAVEIKDMAVER